jgi:hypothetical protein
MLGTSRTGSVDLALGFPAGIRLKQDVEEHKQLERTIKQLEA